MATPAVFLIVAAVFYLFISPDLRVIAQSTCKTAEQLEKTNERLGKVADAIEQMCKRA
jgi:hypothetical protein